MKWTKSRAESKNLETELNTAGKSYKTFTLPKTCSNRSSLLAPFPGAIGTYHSIPLIWTLPLQSHSKVSPRTDSGHLSRSGQDHSSSREPHPKLRKRRPWALGGSSIPDPKPLPLSSRKQPEKYSAFFPIFFFFNDLRVWMKESLGPRKENKCQRPLLNHLTLEKTKQNFRFRSDALGQLHLSETYHPLPGNLPPPTPAQKTY